MARWRTTWERTVRAPAHLAALAALVLAAGATAAKPPVPEGMETEPGPPAAETVAEIPPSESGLLGWISEPLTGDQARGGMEGDGTRPRPGVLTRPLETPTGQGSVLSQPELPAFSSGKFFLAPTDAPLDRKSTRLNSSH